MKISLNTPKRVITAPAIAEQSMMISEVDVDFITDDGQTVKSVVTINGASKVVVLWEGEDYEAIGDWTQAQANARIIEKL
jgi:hypothetical protein